MRKQVPSRMGPRDAKRSNKKEKNHLFLDAVRPSVAWFTFCVGRMATTLRQCPPMIPTGPLHLSRQHIFNRAAVFALKPNTSCIPGSETPDA